MVILRTGAAHPLPNFNGCGRTRRTRSSCAPGVHMKLCKYWLLRNISVLGKTRWNIFQTEKLRMKISRHQNWEPSRHWGSFLTFNGFPDKFTAKLHSLSTAYFHGKCRNLLYCVNAKQSFYSLSAACFLNQRRICSKRLVHIYCTRCCYIYL